MCVSYGYDVVRLLEVPTQPSIISKEREASDDMARLIAQSTPNPDLQKRPYQQQRRVGLRGSRDS